MNNFGTPSRQRFTAWLAVAVFAPAVVAAQSRCPPPGPPPPLPDTISPAATTVYKQLMARRAHTPPAPTPTTIAEWDAHRAALERMVAKFDPSLVESLGTSVTPMTLAAVPVLMVSPKTPDPKRILIYVHGGAFTAFSAKSTLNMAALMASKSGMTVYSIDYTVAPHAQWREITDQVIGVYKALLARNHAAADIGMFGDSAGGAIVAGSVLKLRDAGAPMPGALVLMSPATDLGGSGDTYCSLGAADPILSVATSEPSMAAYAPLAEQKNPYVSPVYGDYGKGFPPTLIQGGTRELLLSGFVREYQAIEQAGGDAVLDLYEGMPHDFQTLMAGSPESNAAFVAATRFWAVHLGAHAAKATRHKP
jgi:monoterpene epsilon-lactone hydrolase